MALVCIDFDQTIVSGHVHNAISNYRGPNGSTDVALHTPYAPTFTKNEALESAQWNIAKEIGPAGPAEKWKQSIESLLQEGHSVAITSFTKYPHIIEKYLSDVIQIEPSLMRQIHVVGDYPKKDYPNIVPGMPCSSADDFSADDKLGPELVLVGKTQHIELAIKHFEANKGVKFEAKDIFLIDDSSSNVAVAKNKNYNGIEAGKGTPENADLIEKMKAEYSAQFAKAPQQQASATVNTPPASSYFAQDANQRIARFQEKRKQLDEQLDEQKMARNDKIAARQQPAPPSQQETTQKAFAAQTKPEINAPLPTSQVNAQQPAPPSPQGMTQKAFFAQTKPEIYAPLPTSQVNAQQPAPPSPQGMTQKAFVAETKPEIYAALPTSQVNAQQPAPEPAQSKKEYTSSLAVLSDRNQILRQMISDIKNDHGGKLSSAEKHELNKIVSALKTGLRGDSKSFTINKVENKININMEKFQQACDAAKNLFDPLVAAKKAGVTKERSQVYGLLQDFKYNLGGAVQLKETAGKILGAAAQKMGTKRENAFNPNSPMVEKQYAAKSKEFGFLKAVATYNNTNHQQQQDLVRTHGKTIKILLPKIRHLDRPTSLRLPVLIKRLSWKIKALDRGKYIAQTK